MTNRQFSPEFLNREWESRADRATDDQHASTFVALTWNLQADKMRYPKDAVRGINGLRPGEDNSAMVDCLRALFGQGECIGLSEYADIVMLQELQQCSRHVKRGDCRHHTQYKKCNYDHAAWVDATFKQEGYLGGYHNRRWNTCGLYFRPDVWENITDLRSPPSQTKLLFITFDGYKANGSSAVGAATREELELHSDKNAVLAVLMHRVTGQKVLAISTHLSVPKDLTGAFNTTRQMAELAQLGSKIENVITHHGPMHILIGGDMNCVDRHISDAAPPNVFLRLTQEWGLSSSYTSVGGIGFPAYSSLNANFRHCIDHMVSSPDLIPRSVLTVRPELVSAVPGADTPYPSDHLPLATEYLLFNSGTFSSSSSNTAGSTINGNIYR